MVLVLTERRLFQCHVEGRPAPQGSKTPTKYGGFRESSKYLKPWRDAVVLAATLVKAEDGFFKPFDGPVRLNVTFFIERPKSTKWGRYPAGTPDLSKLMRSTEDALTAAGVWVDDALVVKASVEKLWTSSDPGSYPKPGCFIAVEAL